jgi:hypothetical protein
VFFLQMKMIRESNASWEFTLARRTVRRYKPVGSEPADPFVSDGGQSRFAFSGSLTEN